MKNNDDSYEHVQLQIKKLQQRAEEIKNRERTPVLKAIVKHMLTLDLTINDIASAYEKYRHFKKLPSLSTPPVKRKKYTSRPKYQDPVSGTFWSGKGKTPRWLVGYLQEGRSKEEFLIEKEK